MRLDSARDLKQHLTATVLAPFTAAGAPVTRLSVPTGPISAVPAVQPSIALGIAPRGPGDFQVAVRCQRPELVDSKEVNQIRSKAKGEADVRFIGTVSKRADPPWVQQRHRPLKIGTSVGHLLVTAGTLGCFVRKHRAEGTYILSNNHVLANEDRAKKADAILQQARFDGGSDPADVVGHFQGAKRLQKNGANKVDVAIAQVLDGIEFDPKHIRGLGNIQGLGPAFLDEGTEVAKLGRTTGLTRGTVTAFEMDNVVVEFDKGNLKFDGQIEIESAGEGPFSLGGDSGSLIVEAETRLAVALLFAGTVVGGTNGHGLTYAHPIREVLDALRVDLVFE